MRILRTMTTKRLSAGIKANRLRPPAALYEQNTTEKRKGMEKGITFPDILTKREINQNNSALCVRVHTRMHPRAICARAFENNTGSGHPIVKERRMGQRCMSEGLLCSTKMEIKCQSDLLRDKSKQFARCTLTRKHIITGLFKWQKSSAKLPRENNVDKIDMKCKMCFGPTAGATRRPRGMEGARNHKRAGVFRGVRAVPLRSQIKLRREILRYYSDGILKAFLT